jgi:hypothetical protein
MNKSNLKASLIIHLNKNISVTIEDFLYGKKYSKTIMGVLEQVSYSGGFGIISGVAFDLSDITEIRSRIV